MFNDKVSPPRNTNLEAALHVCGVEAPDFEAPLRGPFPGPPPPRFPDGKGGQGGGEAGWMLALSRGIYQLPSCTYLRIPP
jgi:hypothetical protein